MKTITLLHTSDNMLPRSVRSYIDTCAHEFNQIDTWTKIAQIAYRIKRGVDLLPAFMEDIERHMKHPAYGDYEDGAKRSIATYIELLRTGDEYGMSTVSLPDNMSFPKIFLFMKILRFYNLSGIIHASLEIQLVSNIYHQPYF